MSDFEKYMETDWNKTGTIRDVFPDHPSSWDEYVAMQQAEPKWKLGRDWSMGETTTSAAAGSYDRPIGTYGKRKVDKDWWKKADKKGKKKKRKRKKVKEARGSKPNVVWVSDLPDAERWAKRNAEEGQFLYFPTSRKSQDLVMVPMPGSGSLDDLTDRLGHLGVTAVEAVYEMSEGDVLFGPGEKVWRATRRDEGGQ